jgi:hypothetical protein
MNSNTEVVAEAEVLRSVNECGQLWTQFDCLRMTIHTEVFFACSWRTQEVVWSLF